MSSASLSRKQLGRILIDKGILTEDQLRIALLEQAKHKQPIGKLLVSLGFVSEATLRDALSESLGKQSVDLTNLMVDPAALRLVPREIAKRHHVLPLDYEVEQKRLSIAITDANDIVALDRVRGLIAGDIEIDTLLAGEADIDQAIDQAYGYELSIDGILHEIETGEIDLSGLQSITNEYSQPVVRLIDAILTDAVKREASDIHFEPEIGFLRIRYRIDGMLRQIRSLHQSYWPAMAVRIKVMSGMNIAETRAPQDGRITLGMRGRPIDFRVSAQPTIHGENIVLRILDRQKGLVTLDGLGLTEGQLDLLKLMIARPEGIILVTGPTGSGKTTTLYSVLNHINSEGINIMTLEDPVEYPMPLVRRLCPHCKAPYQAEAHETLLLGGGADSPPPIVFRPTGCERCDFQGYRGRLAIMEILRMNADMDELVARRSTAREIRQAAIQQGFVPLAEDGLRRVLDGSTSLAELGRVVDLTDRM